MIKREIYPTCDCFSLSSFSIQLNIHCGLCDQWGNHLFWQRELRAGFSVSGETTGETSVRFTCAVILALCATQQQWNPNARTLMNDASGLNTNSEHRCGCSVRLPYLNESKDQSMLIVMISWLQFCLWGWDNFLQHAALQIILWMEYLISAEVRGSLSVVVGTDQTPTPPPITHHHFSHTGSLPLQCFCLSSYLGVVL